MSRRLWIAAFLLLSSLPFLCRADQSGSAPAAPRCRTLAAMKNPDPQFTVELMLIPVVLKRAADGTPTGIDHEVPLAGSESIPHLAADSDDFILKARVTGTGAKAKSAHVAVLELQPATDHADVLWPVTNAPSLTDAVPADGQWHSLLWHPSGQGDAPVVFTATKPYGKEIYKAFATTDPVDFAAVLSPDGSRAPLTPIGMAIKDALNALLGGKPAPPPSDSNPGTVVVEVVSKH